MEERSHREACGEDGGVKIDTFVDLFAGIGGFHLGLQACGLRCVLAAEIDPLARAHYKLNFGVTPCGDVQDLVGTARRDVDMLVAGSPCQDFSHNGRKRGLDGERGRLIFAPIEIAQSWRPKVVVLENVPGILGESGDEAPPINAVTAALDHAGYDVQHAILRACDFELPQVRRRIFIVGFRRDLDVRGFRFPDPVGRQIAVRDIIGQDDWETELLFREARRVAPRLIWSKGHRQADINATPAESTCLAALPKRPQRFRVQALRGSGTTLMAAFRGLSNATYHFGSRRIRRLTTAECQRMQGFPQDFRWLCGRAERYRLLGNSVCPPVVEALGRAIMQALG